MSNVYEALMQAQWQQGTVEESCAVVATPDVLVEGQEAMMEREMVELHLNIESLLPDTPRKVIQFTSSRVGEGVSTVVREYACMAAAKLGKSVLVIDADRADGGHKVFPHVKNMYGWDDAVLGQAAVEDVFSRIGNSNLYVSGYSSRPDGTSALSEPGRVMAFFERLRERFDLVLIDSPPATNGLDTIAFMCSVDGVILVVEAEKTRWPIVESEKNRILNSGSKILGIVFNKRRNYIPECIYTRL